MTDSTIPGEPIRCQQYIGNRHVSAIWADEIVFNTPQAAEKAFTCCAGCILQYIVIQENNTCRINPNNLGQNGYRFFHKSRSETVIQQNPN
jgi:hypothetical protein